MKKIVSALLIVLATNAFAQTKTKTTTSKTTTTAKTTTAKPKLSAADITMCDKEWHVVSVEEWDVVTKPPGEKNKNDMLKLTQDGKFDLVMFGNKKSGTWVKSGQYIYMTDAETKQKISFKVLSADATKLRVDHFSDEDGHSIFEYEPK
ncbi:MAG: hypothetical protein ACXVPU_08060 [Bacteroidia bacterium]